MGFVTLGFGSLNHAQYNLFMKVLGTQNPMAQALRVQTESPCCIEFFGLGARSFRFWQQTQSSGTASCRHHVSKYCRGLLGGISLGELQQACLRKDFQIVRTGKNLLIADLVVLGSFFSDGIGYLK